MPRFPCTSSGVIAAPVGSELLVFDLTNHTLHRLNPSAGAVLLACDGVRHIDDAVAEWAAASDLDTRDIAADVAAVLADLRSLGLIDRHDRREPPSAPRGSRKAAPPDAVTGALHRVIDHLIQFRGAGPAAAITVAAIDAFLALSPANPAALTPGPASAFGSTTPARASSAELHSAGLHDAELHDAELHDAERRSVPMFFDVRTDPTGDLVLTTDDVRTYDGIDSLLAALATVTNEYATWTHTCVTLHAGAVRSPAGQVALLPAPSGSGKSTLTAALVMAGWDYLSDEAIGVRADTLVAVGYPKRLSLDLASRTALGLAADVGDEVAPADLRSDVRCLIGDVDPITRVVLPRHVPGARASLERLTPEEAAVEILANTFNLARVGQGGLETICALAESVPVERMVFDDVHAAVDMIRTREHTNP